MTASPPPPPPPPASKPKSVLSVPVLVGLLAIGVAGGAYLLLSGGDDGPAGSSTTVALGSTTTVAPGSSTTGAETTTTTAPTTTAATTSTTAATTTTAAATTTTAAAAVLDPRLGPNYGGTTLDSGFLPDPALLARITSGGPVDASYLEVPIETGGTMFCSGWATSQPDFELTYSPGAYPMLRIYFIADDPTADTVLIVNDPSGTWSCGDDSYSTRNPSLDFPGPAGGVYDIWVGSYSLGVYVPGSLYATEDENQHP